MVIVDTLSIIIIGYFNVGGLTLTCVCAQSVQAGGKTRQFSSSPTLGCERATGQFYQLYWAFLMIAAFFIS